MTPSALIAAAIQRERARAGLSLSALAARAGLSKSTLSQLETGRGNPSLETLWALASALEVPFSFLFEAEVAQPCLIRADEGAALAAAHADFTATLLAASPPGRRRDLYRTEMRGPSVRLADPHPQGTVEHVLMSAGRARVGPVGATEVLGPGDYFRYPGDLPHQYEALSDRVTFMVAMEMKG